MSPGHPLFAAISERLDIQLNEQIRTGSAIFIDADADQPYRLYFFQVQIAGQQRLGRDVVLKAQLCAIAQIATGELILVSPDCLNDLAPSEISIDLAIQPPTPQEQQQAEDWLKVKVQIPMIEQERQQRQRELHIRQDYLKQAMESAIREAQITQMNLAAKVAAGDETYRVARDNAQNKVRNLQERYKNKQTELDYLKIIRSGRVAYLGAALVHPGIAVVAPGMRNDPEVEEFAMQWVMNYERDRGWKPQDISKDRDASGFDIRSIGSVEPDTGKAPVRRIEVKGRAQLQQKVSLTENEWRKAQQLGDSYWLYVVWGCKTTKPQLLMIQNPAKKLTSDAKEVKQVTRYLVGSEALIRCAE